MNIYEIAKKYNTLGLCVIPIIQKPGDEDMSKLPVEAWKQYQTKRPGPEKLSNWFNNGRPRNLALLGGGRVW